MLPYHDMSQNNEILKERVLTILAELKKLFPNPKPALNFSNPWECMVAVILSAQCTDKMVNIVTEKLFKKYTKLEDYVNAKPEEFEQDIKSTGFYKNKTKNILASARLLLYTYGGVIPNSMEEILKFHGVARKTGNIVLHYTYGLITGIAVDTHVRRLSKLLGLTKNDDPEKIEQDLMKLLPKEEWMKFSFLLVLYGRIYCSAKKHDHEHCPLSHI